MLTLYRNQQQPKANSRKRPRNPSSSHSRGGRHPSARGRGRRARSTGRSTAADHASAGDRVPGDEEAKADEHDESDRETDASAEEREKVVEVSEPDSDESDCTEADPEYL